MLLCADPTKGSGRERRGTWMVAILLAALIVAAATCLVILCRGTVDEAVQDLRRLVRRMAMTFEVHASRQVGNSGHVQVKVDLPEIVPYSQQQLVVLADAGPFEVLPRTQVVEPALVARDGLSLRVLAPAGQPAEVGLSIYDARTMTPLVHVVTRLEATHARSPRGLVGRVLRKRRRR